MPFTFSHPAIVLPLTSISNKWISATGLIIGSMVPDFEYFLRMKVKSDYSHTLAGTFWFDLPVALVTAFVFHNIVRNCLINNLPGSLKSRAANFHKFGWNRHFKEYWFIVILSILIGVASHIFWDNFTHVDGYFVKTFPALNNTVEIFGFKSPVFKLLQHGSTLLGALLIVYTVFKLPKSNVTGDGTNKLYWRIVIIMVIFTILIRFLITEEDMNYGNILVTTIAAIFLAMALTPLLLRRIA
jgi:hypothetical protein